MLFVVAAADAAGVATPRDDNRPTGPYDAVAGWLKPVDASRVTYPVSVFAESPDRIFIGNKGSSPPPGNAHGFDPKYPGTRTDHLLLVVDRYGRLVEEWSQWAQLFGSLHKVKINPYDAAKHVWVIDRASQQVLEFTHDGKKLVRSIGERGVPGSDERHFGRPTDIAWLPDGTFFVSDGYDNTRVVKFAADGRFLMQWGTRGTGPGQFNEPHGIAIDAQRRIYVADRLNARIQVFDENGRFLSQWHGFDSPAAILVSQDQSVWVLDNGTGRVCKYDTAGRRLYSWGMSGDFPGGMADPHDFWVDGVGAVYISNGHAHRVDKYVPASAANPGELVGRPFVVSKAGVR